MTQPNDGSGRAPVAIVRPTTSVTSGVAVTQKLVSAAVAFGNLLKGTFGPNGLDKMLYKTNGETAVTNDGAKIVAELLVKHPAAKAFVQLAQSHENACGNGVTGCLIFASELMREAGNLLQKGLHPLVLVDGFLLAMEETNKVLAAAAMKVTNSDDEALVSIAKTAMTGTSSESNSDELAEMIVAAAKNIAVYESEQWRVDTQRVRMAKSGLGSISDTKLIDGIVIEKNLEIESLPHILGKGRIAVLSCPLEIEKTNYDSEIEISTSDQWESFIDAEDNILSKKAAKIIDSGASIVVCAETIDSRVLHKLADSGIFTIASLERSGAQDVALTCGALMVDHLDDLDDNTLGEFTSLKVESHDGDEGRRDRIFLDGGENSGLSTIDVGGAGGITSEEFIRGIYDALNSVANTLESGLAIEGGGYAHILASLALKEFAETISGRERLAIEAFARALESIPATLLTNSGNNQLDGLLQLRSALRNGEKSVGINVHGKVETLSNVLDCYDTIIHGLEAACETACGLLRVDQVISARGD